MTADRITMEIPTSTRLLTALAAAAAVLATGTASAGVAEAPPRGETAGSGSVRTATTGNHSELVKTIPISSRKGAKRRAVMSLGPGSIGELENGDRLQASAEVEVSVCLKPNELHGGNRPCIGRTYDYDPTVIATLVLTADSGAGTRGTQLAREKVVCTQKLPDRNHHCVLVLEGETTIASPAKLPCDPAACALNVVLSAHDARARSGDKLVVGSDSGGKSVNGDKGRVNLARFRPADGLAAKPLVSEDRVRERLPIAPEGGDVANEAIYSVALEGLEAGEQLVIDARMASGIGHHPYNVFQTTSLVLSEGRDSASREGWPERVGDLNGQIAEANGFNCTQGRSAHPDPCVARKVGVLEITRDSPQTLYVNLVAGMAAQFNGERHRRGDTAKIRDEGFLRVYRYDAKSNDSPPD